MCVLILSPVSNLGACKSQFIISGVAPLIKCDIDVHLLAGLIFNLCILLERVADSIQRDGKQLCPGRNTLRNHDCPEATACLRTHHDSVQLGAAKRSGNAGGIIQRSLTGGIGKNNTLTYRLKLSFFKSAPLHQCHLHSRQPVAQRYAYLGLAGSDI